MYKKYAFGYWPAITSLLLGLAYSIAQILTLFKCIPSPHDLVWMFIPSLLLAPAFLLTVICLHFATVNAKLYSAIAVAFALLYCALTSIVYFSQLVSVIPQQLNDATPPAKEFLFEGNSIMVAIDCLGYGFMSLSSFFAALAFRKRKCIWLYRGLLWHGLLTPVIIGSFFFPLLLAAGALWMVTFPLAMINAAKFFIQSQSH